MASERLTKNSALYKLLRQMLEESVLMGQKHQIKSDSLTVCFSLISFHFFEFYITEFERAWHTRGYVQFFNFFLSLLFLIFLEFITFVDHPGSSAVARRCSNESDKVV